MPLRVRASGAEGCPAGRILNRKSVSTKQSKEPAIAQPAGPNVIRPRLTRKQRLHDAWLDVDEVFTRKYVTWLRQGRMSDDEALEFHGLATDTDKKQVRTAMLQGHSFREALKSLSGLSPTDSIEKLHTKAIQSGGRTSFQLGPFYHIVLHAILSEEAQAEVKSRIERFAS